MNVQMQKNILFNGKPLPHEQCSDGGWILKKCRICKRIWAKAFCGSLDEAGDDVDNVDVDDGDDVGDVDDDDDVNNDNDVDDEYATAFRGSLALSVFSHPTHLHHHAQHLPQTKNINIEHHVCIHWNHTLHVIKHTSHTHWS